MGRGGRAGFEPTIRKRNLHSDSSDEDYLVEEDELDNQSDELESLVGEASEEDYLLDEEDEEDELEIRKVRKSQGRKTCSGKWRNGINQSRKRKRSTYHDEDDDDEDYDESDEEFTPDDLDSLDEEEDFPSAKKKGGRKSRTPLKKRVSAKTKKKRVRNDDDDEDYDESDEEFTPEDLDSLDEEEDLPSAKKKGGRKSRNPLKKRVSAKTRKKRGKKVAKKPRKKKRKSNGRLKRRARSADDGDFMDNSVTRKGKSKKKSLRTKKRVKAASDSDFTGSESSDYEFTMSEEELQQIMEAEEFCGSLTEDLRSSKRCQEDISFCQLKKLPGRKGKEKEEGVKNDMGKQVCGICFTEERKNTVRGTLNCCSHFFCFACIMEWSKVESRCPLCKQRFTTISKPARCVTGVGLRNVVMQVPERDQVYQPSEEELANYLMPYEGVLCTECLQGGDDALMLLCDNCDSPAHTYCVGLGREVPEGNWYCEGCRPAALASSNGQAQDITPRQQTSTIVSTDPVAYENMAEIDLNVTIPETPVSEGNRFLLSPRIPGGNHQAPSPVLGFGVSTLSGRRRMIHRGIHQLLSGNRMSQLSATHDRGSNLDLSGEPFSSNIDHGVERNNRETRVPNVGTSASTPYVDRLQDSGFHPVRSSVPNVGTPTNISCVDRLQDYGFHSAWSQTPFPGLLSQTSAESLRFPASFHGSAFVGSQMAGQDGHYLSINHMSGYEQPQPCSSSSTAGCDTGLSPLHNNAQADYSSLVKWQMRPLVENHLKSLAGYRELSYSAFKDIVNSSIGTILAACGLEHHYDDVYEVRTPLCLHNLGELAGGQMSPMKGCCTSCFDKFVKEVVRTVMDIKERN